MQTAVYNFRDAWPAQEIKQTACFPHISDFKFENFGTAKDRPCSEEQNFGTAFVVPAVSVPRPMPEGCHIYNVFGPKYHGL